MNMNSSPFLKSLHFSSSKKAEGGNGPIYAVNDNHRRSKTSSTTPSSMRLFLITVGAIASLTLLYFFLF